MIEVIYKGENQEEAESIMLPKNVRQVGEVQKDKKVYIEDYVVTYMKQKITENKNLGCILVLTGRREYVQDSLYLFVDGAFAVDYGSVGPEYAFTDKVWEKIYENVKKYFISGEIVGWLLYDDDLTEDKLLKAQKKNFPAEDMLLLKQESYEEESEYYLYRGSEFQKLPGFFVYYEKNQAMQEFMVNNYQTGSVEEEQRIRQREAPVATFRSRMKEKRETPVQNRAMGAMYAVSSFLILLVIIVGITMVNNYDKMKNMEYSLNDLAAVSGDGLLASAQQENEKASGELSQEEKQETSAKVELAPSGVEPEAETPDQTVETEALPAEPIAEENGTGVGEMTTETPAAVPETSVQVSENTESVEEESTAAAAETKVYYTVQLGDTLAGISKRVYGHAGMVAKICILNGIENGDKILAGQKILLP